MKRTNEQTATRVSVVTMLANALLSVFKLIAGIFGNSIAMLSDAVHSVSDVLSTIIVIIGIKLSGKEEDEEHQYGHERLECVAAIVLAVLLFATGIGIGYGGVVKILDGINGEIAIPGTIALVAAIVSIAVKEGMFWYTRAAAKKTGYGTLMADAWHHRSDALSSIGSLIGIFGARMGVPLLDPIASILICVLIVKVAVDIFRDAIAKMTDRACDEETVQQIRAVILQQEGVMGIDLLRTRRFGEKIYVDVEISLEGTETLIKSHDTAHAVHDAIEQAFPSVKHCMVHLNPKEKDIPK